MGKHGSREVQRFYDERGWARGNAAATVDKDLFGALHVGPIQLAAYRIREERICRWFRRVGTGLNMLDCGCGAHPALFLAPLCRSMTALDFSTSGLVMARAQLTKTSLPLRLTAGDMCQLPFGDGTFDGVFSAHALYHIVEVEAQLAAHDELLRVLRPGGMAVLVSANPRPLAFPLTFAKRLLAESPLGPTLNRFRPPAPLPYRPLRLGHIRRHLSRHGTVSIEVHQIASMWFRRHVGETGLGRAAWRAISLAERRWPYFSAFLGNYVTIAVHKASAVTG